MAANMEAGYGGISYSSLGSFAPSVRKNATFERRRNIAKIVAAFALTAAAVCVVFASGTPLGSAALSAPPTRRDTMLFQMPEMVLASKTAGFDLTSLLQMPRTTQLDNSISNTGLCRKRDKIIKLFNDLLARLIDEEGSQEGVKTTLGVSAADSHTAYVDAEAAYELAKKTHADAIKMKNLAITRASTAITAYDAAVATYATNKAPYQTELTSIASDIDLIKELLQMLSVLHAEPAGGVATQATKQARLQANILKIQKLSLRIKSPKGLQLAAKLSTQSLAVYEESSAVVKILTDLLQDVLDRQAFIHAELKEFKDEMDAALVVKEAKEGVVVDASATEAAALAEANQYTGAIISQLSADADSAAIAETLQKTLVTKAGVQFTRERYVIGQIMMKINAYCNEIEDQSVDIAHMSCPFPDAMKRYSDVCTCKGGFTGPDVTGPCETCADDEYCFSTTRGHCAANAELVADHSKCLCSHGFHGPDNAGPCVACPEGHMCPGGDFEPDQCPSGKIANDDHSACVIKPGFYADAADTAELAAVSCTDGKVCLGGAGGAEADCLANSEPNEGQTSCVCNPGFTGADNGACATCPAGSKCAGGAAAPETCGANSESSTDKTDCECKEGFHGPNSGTCEACPSGSFCIGGNNVDSCPAHSTSSNEGKSCSCNAGYSGDGKTCGACAAGHICAGDGAAPVYCAGAGRTPNEFRTECICTGLWKDWDNNADCRRKTYEELTQQSINVPECTLDTNQPHVVLDRDYDSDNQQRFGVGKWKAIPDYRCINEGMGNTGKAAEACVIHNCKFYSDSLSKAYFYHGATARFFEHSWWNGQHSDGSGNDWYGRAQGLNGGNWEDQTSSFIVSAST